MDRDNQPKKKWGRGSSKVNNGKEKERRESSTFQKSGVASRAECEGEKKKEGEREREANG